MKHRNMLGCAIALASLALMVVEFPPFQITWHKFLFGEPERLTFKLLFLLKVYGVPFLMSFIAILLLQMQGRLSMLGAAASSVFPLSLLGAAGMMVAFRSMVAGVGGIPGYALGMALAYTVASRVYAIQPAGRTVFGRPMLRIVWRGELEAQRAAAMQLQARESAPGSEHAKESSMTSNSAKNNSLSLSRAEAGI